MIRAGDQFFKRHGSKAVFFARWIALVRFAAAWLAGINRMPFKQFFFWNALGGITWGITYGLVGYFGGHAAAKYLSEVGVIGAILLVVAVVVGLILLRRRERRAGAAHPRRRDRGRGRGRPGRGAMAEPERGDSV